MDKIVRMANEIAAFFRTHPPEEAPADLRRHIEDFWTPSMRATLRARIAAGDAELDALVVRAFGEG